MRALPLPCAPSTLIDNSKKPRWAKNFIKLDGYSIKYIHLIRDPRALVRRWIISYDNAGIKRKVRIRTAKRCWKNAWNILKGDEVNVYINKWLYANILITDFIRDYNLNAKIVTYHDLVSHTDDVLSDIMKWLGMEYDPAQKKYWNFVHHGTVKTAYMKPPAEKQSQLDQRWKDFLKPQTNQRILHHDQINSYLGNIGIKIDEQGGLLHPDR